LQHRRSSPSTQARIGKSGLPDNATVLRADRCCAAADCSGKAGELMVATLELLDNQVTVERSSGGRLWFVVPIA
jgi:hypothetical protein